MTIKELVDDVNRGEIVMINNDWYWDSEFDESTKRLIWNKIYDGKNADLLNYTYLYHPEFQMDDDESAAVTWIYLKRRS